MLSLSLITLGLAAVGAYAKPPVHAVGGLEISLSTPTNKVASVSDLKITATVKNVGDEDLKILKFGTVLDNESHSRAFIVSKDGKEVPFAGTTVCVPSFPTFALSSIFTLTVPIGSDPHGAPLQGRLGCHTSRQEFGCRAPR